MDKNNGNRTEKTRTEIDVISKEKSKVESLGSRSKQLCAKDTSHGRVSEMLIKGDGIKKANILYRPDKIMDGKELSVADTSKLAVQIAWKHKAIAADIIDRNSRAKEVQSQGKNEPRDFQVMQGTEQQENQEEVCKEQKTTGMPQADIHYSPAPPSPTVFPALIYPTARHKNNSGVLSEKKIERITGKNSKQSKQENPHPSIERYPVPVEKNHVPMGKHHPFIENTSETFCHDGRKLEQGMGKQDSILATLPQKDERHLKARIKGQNILCVNKAGLKRQSILYVNKMGTVKLNGKKISFSYPQNLDNKEKSCTSCHDGRKLKEHDTDRKEYPGNAEGQKAGKMAKGRKRVESSLCASYRALKRTGSAAAFMAKDAVGSKVADKHARKKEERTERKYEKKRDTLLEQKGEIKQFIAKKKSDGLPFSKEEIEMLEKKLGIASKKDKGEQNVSDKRNKKLQKLQKANSKKIKKTESKLKNIPKKTNKELWRRNVSAQMKFQARSYAIRRLTEINNETEGTGLGGMLLSLVKTGGFELSRKAFKAIGSLLLKIVAPILPAILAIIIVPILCLLLIGGIAGGNEENQAQAQEASPGEDYYLSSLNVLYGHANSTITSNATIMKWKTEVKKELIRQGIDKSWTDMVLCMMWQESKGLGNDIMQSGGATPKDSIRAGISVLKSALAKCAQYKSTDIKLVLYCYNYGPGFADYIYKEWDGVCSEEAAQARTNTMLASHPEWNVYGDPKYAQHVLQNYVFEENPDLKPDSAKWCQDDKDNVSKCSLTSVTSYACKFIGNKYVWGGTSLTNGCDCSGFTQQVYKHFGVNIPRTSGAQSQSGKKISSLSDAIPGDLLFYGDGGTVSHVALYLGNNIIVHASNSKPYPSGGIKTTSPANYRSILAIRRYSK